MTEEEFLRERLRILHESYLKDAQPIIDRLVRITANRAPSMMVILDSIDRQNLPEELKT